MSKTSIYSVWSQSKQRVMRRRSVYPYFLLLFFLFSLPTSVSAQKKKKRRKAQIEKVVATSRSYIGTPYKWGGTTKRGIDCSGLIQNTYQAVGIKLPRTAKEQSKVGHKKDWESLRTGDLVYFKFKEKGEGRWYHSGILTHVAKEKILFVHASSSRGVVESSLLSSYYKENVKSFRRVIR